LLVVLAREAWDVTLMPPVSEMMTGAVALLIVNVPLTLSV
jgi:hypothetical protein